MPRVSIIGGSYAGLKALSTIFSVCSSPNLRVTLVAPSTHAYYNLASPRLLSEPGKFDDTVFPIEEFVKSSSQNRARFVHGQATRVNFEDRNVTIEKSGGGASKIEYDILVIASGTRAKWPGYKVNMDYQDARKEIVAANKALQKARSVAIVGGGVTGVETAGEIAAEFKNTKVTLYSGAAAPLDGVVSTLSDKATEKLEQLNVDIVNNVQVESVKHKNQDSATVSSVMLDTGEIHEYDLILESFISGPYSSFLESNVKDDKGYVLTDGTLLVEGQDNVVALGDIVSGSSNSVVDLKFGQVGVFRETIKRLLCEVEQPVKSQALEPNKPSSSYVPITHTMVVPISRRGGVGMFNWIPLPSFFVWFGKAKTFMIEKARAQFM